MKILFLTNSYLVGNSGGIYATKAFINAFASISESMTLLYSIKEGAYATDIIDKKVNMIPIWDHRSIIRKFIDLCFGTVNRYQKNIFKYVNPNDYDTVVFNNSDVSSGLVKRFKKAGLRIITIHHNYQIEYLKDDCRKSILIPSLFWTYFYEGTAVRNSDINLTLTNEDSSLLKKHYGGKNFATIGIFEFKESNFKSYKESKRGHNYVITGWLGSKQTDDSLIPWIKHYYPILKECDPKARLTIAGKDPSLSLCSIAKANGINVIASPKDMQPILDSADYYICPTDRGGGLKLRILDGLKSGLPVITHKISARGYDKMNNLGLVCSYHNYDTFRKGIQKLLSSNLSRKEIVNLYQDHYSLKAGINRLNVIIQGFVHEI